MNMDSIKKNVTKAIAKAKATHATSSLSRRQRIAQEALNRYDNIVGRFDTMDRIPSRELIEPSTDTEAQLLLDLGAQRTEQGQWIVPEGLDINDFSLWWPQVPEDLRDKKPRLLSTRDGRPIESYVLPEDRAKGSDSTATSLVYEGFAITAALSYLGFSVWAPLGWLPLLTMLPVLVWTLSQSERATEAAKSALLLTIGPLCLALVSAGLGAPGIVGTMTGLLPSSIGIGMQMGVGVLVFLLLAFVGAFVLDQFDPNRRDGVLGDTFQKFKSALKWTAVYATAYYACRQWLPNGMQPLFYLAMPTIYPMVYTNANFVRRAKLLKHIGEMFNLARMGALANAHVEPKRQQAVDAFKDKSPLIPIGTATGYLTGLHYAYGPDKGAPVVVSADGDMPLHMLCFGRTGAGKTYSFMRPIAKAMAEKWHGGALILDGKGALAGDLSGLLHVLIKPSVDFNPIEGLDGNALAKALWMLGKDENANSSSDPIWSKGADDYRQASAILFEALHTHELRVKEYAAATAKLKQMERDVLRVEVAKQTILARANVQPHAATAGSTVLAFRDQAGELAIDHGLARALEKAESDYRFWSKKRDMPRQWAWTWDNWLRVLYMGEKPMRTPEGMKPGLELQDALAFLGLGASDKQLELHPATVHPDLGTQGLLDDAIHYLTDAWPNTHESGRSSFFMNVKTQVTALTTDPYLVGSQGQHWKTIEKGVDAGACLYGKWVGIEVPAELHGNAGLLVQALVKQRIYKAVALRGSNPGWEAEGQRPLMLMMDECQDLVGEAERNLLPKARSLGLRAVMATQGYDSLVAAFNSEIKARQFANTFQHVITLQAQDETYEYMADRLGVAQLLTYEQPGIGLDMDGGVRALAASPLNDLNHPNRAAMRKMERLGAGRLVVQGRRPITKSMDGRWTGHQLMNIDEEFLSKDIIVPQGGKMTTRPLLLPEEYKALLVGKGMAVVSIVRAGVPRVDVVQLNGVGPDELRKKD
jgi:hypothetical protein